MEESDSAPVAFDFGRSVSAGLLVCAGGFEQRSRTFSSKLDSAKFRAEDCLLIRYKNEPIKENEAGYKRLKARINGLCSRAPETVAVNDNNSIQAAQEVRKAILAISSRLEMRNAIVDISAMTHLLAVCSVHACLSCGLRTTVVYTEAQSYFPTKKMRSTVVRAWQKKEYDVARKFLQRAGLKAVHILPEFCGNFRPGHQTCLIVFAGYEPNRLEGLVDDYSPGAVIVLYGISPYRDLQWRTELSKQLHETLFSQWHVRRREVSTLRIEQILSTLEIEYGAIRDTYDLAVAPQCSKMQALATYVFWRKHPEIQLVFTSPVSFNPKHYSRGTGTTFQYEIG